MTITEPTWSKPGPGTWDLDLSHAGPAPCPIQRDIYETCVERGTGDGFALFGTPLRAMQMRWVNGKFYRRLVPLIGGSRDLRPPPAPVAASSARSARGSRWWRRRVSRSSSTRVCVSCPYA